MYALCLKCYKIYDRDVYHLNENNNICPMMSCQGSIILVDENMLPIIIELNKKGYVTRNCCSSHIWDPDMYIQFQPGIILLNPPKGFDIEIQSIYGEIENRRITVNEYTIRWEYLGKIESLSPLENQRRIFRGIGMLSRWVEGLPDLNSSTIKSEENERKNISEN